MRHSVKQFRKKILVVPARKLAVVVSLGRKTPGHLPLPRRREGAPASSEWQSNRRRVGLGWRTSGGSSDLEFGRTRSRRVNGAVSEAPKGRKMSAQGAALGR